MRVIAGKWRSRPLLAPEGMDTRPTADRLRESLEVTRTLPDPGAAVAALNNLARLLAESGQTAEALPGPANMRLFALRPRVSGRRHRPVPAIRNESTGLRSATSCNRYGAESFTLRES